MILSAPARRKMVKPPRRFAYPLAAWERPLLSQAYEALLAGAGTIQQREAQSGLASPAALERAYRHCNTLTAHHSRSFYLASAMLPAHKRDAMRALYAFCRTADDIVDSTLPMVSAQAALEAWGRRALGAEPSTSDLVADLGADLVALAWADTRQRYHIPVRFAEQLLDGLACDLRQARYQTFDELAAYAYGVASTVGLMSMHITGFSGRQAIPYAIKLGVALQVTNILRDVAEDWRLGRVYLPAEELAAFNLSEMDLANGSVDDRWRGFMRFQIERNRRLYAEAWPGIAMLEPDGRLAIAAAAEFYAAILDDIEAHDYDVFTRRAHLGAWAKLRRLPGLWWRVRTHPEETPYPMMREQIDLAKEKAG
jgi:phytoene synthase